jgi:hypothetical protein
LEISLPRGTPAERHSRPAERHFGPDRTPGQVLATLPRGTLKISLPRGTLEISLPRGTPAERHSRPAERHFGPDRTPGQVLAISQGGICASFCLTGEPAETEQSNGNCKQAYAKVRPGIPDRPLDSWCPGITPTQNKRKCRISQLLVSSGGALHKVV